VSILVVCQCGKKYQLKEELAGKRVRCPACQGTVQVPQPEPLELAPPTFSFDPLDDVLNSPNLPTTPAPAANPYGYQAASAPVASTNSPRHDSSTRRLLLTIGGFLGGMLLLACGLCGVGAYLVMRAPPVSNEAREPFALSSVPVPDLPGRSNPQSLADGVEFYEVVLGERTGTAGHGQRIWVYLPAGQHAPGSLPCVLIAPAGSNLLTGMALGEGDQPEHLPYVQAGLAVIAFELDGMEDYMDLGYMAGGVEDFDADEADEVVENYELKQYNQFRASHAGLVNARNALEYALQQMPEVDPQRVYVAGHSSAGTLALLFAAHEPRLAGCVAYAPAYDLWDRYTSFGIKMLGGMFPDLADFVTQSSPKTHASRIRCPVLLFHAEDDSNVPITESQACERALRDAGAEVTFETVPTGDHYDSMIEAGIPRGIAWLQARRSR